MVNVAAPGWGRVNVGPEMLTPPPAKSSSALEPVAEPRFGPRLVIARPGSQLLPELAKLAQPGPEAPLPVAKTPLAPVKLQVIEFPAILPTTVTVPWVRLKAGTESP